MRRRTNEVTTLSWRINAKHLPEGRDIIMRVQFEPHRLHEKRQSVDCL